MNFSPLVSVIIPAYNHENYVQETIKSIIEQTYQNIELIVVDDGSKDSTWQKIQEMKEFCEKRFIRVHFETKQNEGTCKTLNRLLSLVQGEFVYLIASDDMAKSNAIEKLYNFLSTHKKHDLAVGKNVIIDNNSDIVYWDDERNIVYNEKQAKYKTLDEFLSSIRKFKFNTNKFGSYRELYLHENHIPNGYLIRKSAIDNIGIFTQDAPLEDYWLMLQLSKFGKFKFLNEELFMYRWHNSNTMHKLSKIQEYTKLTKDYEKKQ